MLAARQVLGLPGVATVHYFCTFCDIDYDDCDILKQSEWLKKDVCHIREHERQWRDAPTKADQEHLFEVINLSIDTGGDGTSEFTPPAIKTLSGNKPDMQKCMDLICQNPLNLEDILLSFHCKVLYTICVENNIHGDGHSQVIGTRWVLVKNIVNWPAAADPIPTPALPEQDNIKLATVRAVIGHLTNATEPA
ncbi:hypothetical protein C0995_008611 [Termitomyces sp. Mi166|nr:hypothetical protein C0995_008611 [Termitomyces sp. Mi166\